MRRVPAERRAAHDVAPCRAGRGLLVLRPVRSGPAGPGYGLSIRPEPAHAFFGDGFDRPVASGRLLSAGEGVHAVAAPGGGRPGAHTTAGVPDQGFVRA